MNDTEILNRWRLILGKNASENISFRNAPVSYMEMEDLLDFLYSREQEGEETGARDSRAGGSGASSVTVMEWIKKIRELFPQSTVEIMERHALDKYGMTELVTDKKVLENLQPNVDLLKTILQLKHMMKGDVLETARRIVKTVADEIAERLSKEVKPAFSGKKSRNASPVRTARNLDIKRTIAKNLKNYDIETKRIMLENVYFHGRVRRMNSWRVVIAVDESGSMMDSVIHSAVMAGIFAKLPMIDTKLVIFDTQVVDLSGYVDDPVETLMSVQLGGGTDIARALQYCETLIEAPQRTILVLVSDLCEGGSINQLYATCASIIESGAKFIALTALDYSANPVYDRRVAERISALGADVAAMTPDRLADWVAKIIE